MVERFTGTFRGDESSLLPTVELEERLRRGEAVVLVDVRDVEEQKVSMIPGAVTQRVFEGEILPSLKGQPDGPLVVPYCTVGYRSGMYCRALVREHGLSNVRNGEGIIMWTFDGGRLVRPTSDGSGPSRAPALALESPQAATVTNEVHVYGKTRDALESPQAATVTNEVHVYGKPWDCARVGFHTVYFSTRKGVWKFLAEKLRRPGAKQAFAWTFVFMLFYFCFTPMCGVMYNCGCRMSFSKFGQVETCNVYKPHEHKCPWCSCSGVSCLLVGADSKVFRGIFLLDLIPDGWVLTVLIVVVLHFAWRRLERSATCAGKSPLAILALKVTIAATWFFVYCLVVGAAFFAANKDYPYFLGTVRPVRGYAGLRDLALAPEVFINASYLHAHLDDWVILDARTLAEAGGGVIPTARLAPWQQLSQGGAPADGRTSELKPLGELLSLLTTLGLDGLRPVAVYGAWDAAWGEEGRLFWTLTYLGVTPKLRCLEGGVAGWSAAGFPLAPPNASQQLPVVLPGDVSGLISSSSVDVTVRAATDLVQHFSVRGDVVLVDVRERREFEGVPAGDPYGARRSGHVPGAISWPWREQLFMERPGTAGFRPLRQCDEVLESLPPHAGGGDIVAYCTGGIRSGFAFMVLRSCGLTNVRNYDGSWWAWSAAANLPCIGDGPGCSSPVPVVPAWALAGGSGGGGF